MTSSFDLDVTRPNPPGTGEGTRAPARESGSRHASYELADVFTTTPFGGNPLALFPDASAIPDGSLQRIARELNLSETAFAYPLRKGEWKLRIFTPTMEHPFAGHPTVGSALLLAEREKLSEIILHEGVGPVALTIERTNGGVAIARLTVPTDPEERPINYDPADLAAMISLEPEQLETGILAPRAMSCGVPFLFIRVTSRDALGASRLRKDRWNRLIADSWSPHVYMFTTDEDQGEQRTLHARMFAPLMGIDEDPATGGAAAALAGVLAAQEPGFEGEITWNIAQGVEMGRPSSLELKARLDGGRASDIRVGGSAVWMGRGSLNIASLEKAR